MYAYKKLLAHCLAASGIALCSFTTFNAHAQTSGTEIQQLFEIRLDAQPLGTALGSLSKQTGMQIFAAGELTKDKNAPALAGRMTAEEALNKLLAPAGLSTRRTSSGYVVQSGPAPAESKTLPTVNVRASAIPGEPLPAYAGGQVARGGRLGMLGNRDFMDTPFSITAYTAENMANQQARTLADAVANDASVRNFYSSSFPQDAFYIRGFQVDGDFSFDGLFGVLPLMRTSAGIAERVEILKGPSALLNGMPPTGGVGGTINAVPKRAADTPLNRMTLNYASDSEVGTHLDFGRRFGPDNAFGVRFNGLYSNGDSSLEDHAREFSQFAVGLDYRGDRFRASLDFGKQKEHGDGIENGVFGAVGIDVPDAPDAGDRFQQAWLFHDNKDTYGALRLEYDFAPEWTAFAAAGARKHDFQELYSVGLDLQANGDFNEYFGLTTREYKNKTGTMGVRGKLHTGAVRHEIVMDATRLRQERWDSWANVGAPTSSNLYRPTVIAKPPVPDAPDLDQDRDSTLDSIGIVDVMSMAGDRVQLTLGARRQRVQNEEEDYDKRRITPAVALLVKATKQLSVYGSYIEGLTEAVAEGRAFSPARTKQVEAGVKADFGRWGATAAVFSIKQPSVITINNVSSVSGEQRNTGIELNAFGEPVAGFRILSGLTWLRPELVENKEPLNEGNDAQGVPRLLLNLGAEWDVPGAPGLVLSARAVYTGTQYVDESNAEKIPAWRRVDIGARYATRMGGKPVVLRANLENLFDADYWSNASLYRGAPRTLLLSATVDF